MAISMRRTFVVLIYLGLLAVHPEYVFGLRSIDIELRWRREDHPIMQKDQRMLKEVVTNGLKAEKRTAPVNKKTDPFQSSKRQVGRGSDPIHNRS